MQLSLILPDVLRSTAGRPRITRRQFERAQEQQRKTAQAAARSPAIPGQLALIGVSHGTLVARDFAAAGCSKEMGAVKAAIEAVAAEQGAWVRDRGLLSLCRQALAARPAGERRVGLDIVLRLPRLPAMVAEVLDHAGFGPQAERAEVLRRRRRMAVRASSCAHCLAWKADGARLCRPCRSFTALHSQVGACGSCGRELPLHQGWCRMCLYGLAYFGERASAAGVQLWVDGPGPRRQNWPGYRLVTGPDGVRRQVATVETCRVGQQELSVSPAFVTVGQLALFPTPPRRWEVLHQRELPLLCDQAEALRREFAQHAARHGWKPKALHQHQRTLTMVTAWLGPEAPIEEADLWAISRLGTGYSARRLIPFLAERGLLVPDHIRHADPHRAGVARLRQRVPAHLLAEVDVWIVVLRGEGRRPSPTVPWKTVSGYLAYIVPHLQAWGPSIASLREITTHQVHKAVDGTDGASTLYALRSLFKALKRERVIFHDPARAIRASRRVVVPRPVPSDRLAGLIDRTPTPVGKVAVALVAIHALGAHAIREALLTDLNRSKGTIGLRDASGRLVRLVYLDEFTLSLIASMLKQRATRLPYSTNPHLLITRVTAHDPADPPMSPYAFQRIFRQLGFNARQLRIDRILDEARETADPVHLMKVFGISDQTAMNYVAAAHPERFTAEPIIP
ncbi:hypothetical protein OOK29_42690 [Streptomyces phaeochromogenes]|uniref:hypothetical protein n=1 Tax=Streptomyces TaxID=1883 RepID=UPI0022545BB0|nr:hypothetical protein [Streptomyces phaeochromogenes]MCX5604855.1 hypothetical protein [Streptomyces phaeochromogenes]